MPARDTSAGRRRRGRPPRRRSSTRSTRAEEHIDEADQSSQEQQNASESEQEEQLPRMRLRRRGRPPKRGITSSDNETTTIKTSDRKRRREAKKEPTPEEVEEVEEVEEEEEEESDESDIDEAGEEKIDKQGNLLGGREYKVPTFKLPMRGDQVLMFAMEPARQLNYRDSYLFFHKNPILERIRLSEEERNWLVDEKLLVHWFRNRDVAVVSARSCFKCFGSRIIKRGKRVKDDYFEARAREMGYTEEPEEQVEESESETTGQQQHQQTGIIAGTINEKGDKGNKMGRRTLISRTSRSAAFDATTPVNNATWMHHAALAVGGFNAQLHERRAEKSVFYDIHTNIHQIPTATQPTRVKFECVDNKKDEFTVEDIQFEKQPANAFRGVGRDLLDGTYDMDAVLRAVPDQTKKSAKALLTVKQPFTTSTKSNPDGEDDYDNDEKYPIAIMEGQYQSSFPLHITRFNKSAPKIASPSQIVANNQSMFAQQYYFNQLYHVMNQNISTMAEQQVPPQMQQQQQQQQQQQHSSPSQVSRPPFPHQVSQNFSPVGQSHSTPSYQQQQQQQQQHYVCGYQSSKNQVCRRAVMFPGEKCQYHAHYYARQPHGPHQSQPLMTTIPPQTPQKHQLPPPTPSQQQQQQQRIQLQQQPQPQQLPPQPSSLAENKCAECHYLSAPSELLTKDNACDAFSMIKCSKCTRKYHPVCAHLKTPRQLAAVESYPWACPECKVCCVCTSAGDESTLMICDDCDRGWHTGCCNPKVEKVPEGSWLCPLCADCHGCDEQGDKTEYFHALAPPPTDKIKYPVYLATYCGKCYDNFKNDRFCPCCLKTFSEEDENDDEENEMVACDSCDHWIHTGCDETLTPEKYQSLCDDEEAKYTCPLCADSIKPIHQTNNANLALKGQAQPSGYCVGIVGGKIKARGVVRYKDHKIAVPEIKGTGIAEMPSSNNNKD